MSGRSIVLVIVAIGWLFAAVFAYAFISLFGFFGLGFYGLLLLFICMQVGLDRDANADRSPLGPGRRKACHVRSAPSTSFGTC